MKFTVLISFLFLGVCHAFPADAPVEVVPIVSEENVVEHDGTFHYGFESGDGTVVHQEGHLQTFEDGKEGEVAQGSYSYKDNEGNVYSVTYTADETGFHATGDHLPQPPEIPGPIARAIKFIEEHPSSEEPPQ